MPSTLERLSVARNIWANTESTGVLLHSPKTLTSYDGEFNS